MEIRSEAIVQGNGDLVFKEGCLAVDDEQVEQPVVRKVVFGASLALDEFRCGIGNVEEEVRLLRISEICDQRLFSVL